MLLFLPGLLVYIAGLFWMIEFWDDKNRQSLASMQRTAMEKGTASVIADINKVASTLLALSDTSELKRLAENPSPENKLAVANNFSAFGKYIPTLLQLRYLNAQGHEVVRVNISGNEPFIVPDSQLQDKSRRYYFRDTMATTPGSIYLSYLDLNIEHGSLEYPYNPTLRLATPVTGFSGKKLGILVLNYLGQELLSDLKRGMNKTIGYLYFYNGDNHWFVTRPNDGAWLPGTSKSTQFDKQFPQVWGAIQANKNGTAHTHSGIFTYETIHPLTELAKQVNRKNTEIAIGPQGITGQTMRWIAISHAPGEILASINQEKIRDGFATLTAMLFVWGLLSLIIARLRVTSIHSHTLADRMRRIIEQTSDIIYITDRNGIIEYVNPSFEDITGFSSDEALGKSPRIFQSGEQPAQFYSDLRNTLNSGQPFKGTFINRKRNGDIYHEQKTIMPIRDHSGKITHYASTGKDITEQILTQQRLEYLAYHHPLTGLPNRELFRDRLHTAIWRSQRTGNLVALMFLDLDHFKNINDTLGHTAGDKVLKHVAINLSECVRARDTVAHIGGDEYAIILDDINSVDSVVSVSRKILDLFSIDFNVDNNHFHIGISIGIVLYPLNETDVDNLIKDADTALYHAKSQGRNRYEFYTPDMTSRVIKRVTTEAELRHAVENNEFEIHYQPVIDLFTGKVIGSEALTRWRHPTRGLVFPGEFMDVLEDSRLIVPVTRILIAQACLDSATLNKNVKHNTSIAINVSASAFTSNQGILQPIIEAIENDLITPDKLVIEITESVLLEASNIVKPSLKHLHKLGIRIAIDDFGTGYSSLTYLRQFPIDIVKIDKLFVQQTPHNPDDCALVTGIINMAHSMGIKVVAEGVETAEQLDFLCAQGCDSAQGFLFSPAVTADAFTKLAGENSIIQPWPCSPQPRVIRGTSNLLRFP